MIKSTWRTTKQLRGLVFDIENKPGTYGPGDYTHGKVTAIACRWLDEPDVETRCWTFNRRSIRNTRAGARAFANQWAKADYVIGHHIRAHDKKLIDGFMTTLDLPLLHHRRMVDTYRDQPKVSGYSRSLENLCERWGCPLTKVNMPEHVWEKAYDGIPEFVELMRLRCVTDVEMNEWLLAELIRRDLLLVR